jgi:Zn-dependent peptidase ImmA (M78 family)/transcriptional regulator with XRE-family HTH domain
MAKRVFAKVRPEILRWARESAGVTLAGAADSLELDEEVLSRWEAGDDRPSIPQLRRLATVYKRPLSVFYLQAVPKGFQVVSDFRRPSESSGPFSPELTQEIRFAHQRRELSLELLTDLGDAAQKFTLSCTLGEEAESVGQRLRQYLNIDDSQRKEFASDGTGRVAFNAWRQAAEAVGVLVFQTMRVSAQEASGFALSFAHAPVVVVNRKDSPTRRLFSLAHELVHLALHKSGVSDLRIDEDEHAADSEIEIFCNRVAAAALMPKQLVLAEKLMVAHGASKEWSDSEIVQLSKRYGVSREAMLLRLLAFGRTTRTFYRQKKAQYAEEYERERHRKAARPPAPIPRNMPREALSLFGRPFISLVLYNYQQDRLTLSEVSGYLGLRTKHVEKLQAEMRGA